MAASRQSWQHGKESLAPRPDCTQRKRKASQGGEPETGKCGEDHKESRETDRRLRRGPRGSKDRARKRAPEGGESPEGVEKRAR